VATLAIQVHLAIPAIPAILAIREEMLKHRDIQATLETLDTVVRWVLEAVNQDIQDIQDQMH
jgi:hypothetical protein